MTVTTFVIGAGASVPFGFPTAAGLKDQICASPPVLARPGDPFRDDRQMREMIKQQSKHRADALARSGQGSIDAWLSRYPEHAEWGKLAIAQKLVPMELQCHRNPTNDWIAWFFQQYQSKRGLRGDEFRIITFNYDRTLEIGLVHMFMNSFKMSLDEAIQYLSTLPICHVYGELAFPDLHSMFQRPSGPQDVYYFNAAKGIRVISDERPQDDKSLALARCWVQGVSYVVFLGFSFDNTNLERIGTHHTNGGWVMQTPRCYATGHGLHNAERKTAEKRVGTQIIFGGIAEGCLAFLRNHVDWLG